MWLVVGLVVAALVWLAVGNLVGPGADWNTGRGSTSIVVIGPPIVMVLIALAIIVG